jgi:leader peptidase (prepilin peptidase)/N-methyltransferase
VTWTEHGHPLAALFGLAIGALSGWFVPWLIRVLPEPEAPTFEERDQLEPSDATNSLPPAPPKVAYVVLASAPGLALRTALVSGVVGAALAASVGWTGALLVLLPLTPIGVALAVIDWHTTLLPTRIIGPSYALVVAAVLAAGAIDSDWHAIIRSAYGWAVMGGFFLLLWLVYPRGLGYGDVRLSGVLGFVLGYLGWSTLVVGMYSAFLLGGLGGGLLGLLKVVNRKRFPFGPFILIASVVGVATGPWLATSLGY